MPCTNPICNHDAARDHTTTGCYMCACLTPQVEHGFIGGGGCMSRCRCGKTFSDPIHGEQPAHLVKLREAAHG